MNAARAKDPALMPACYIYIPILTNLEGQHPCDSIPAISLLGIRVPGTACQRSASLVPPAQAGEPGSGFPRAEGKILSLRDSPDITCSASLWGNGGEGWHSWHHSHHPSPKHPSSVPGARQVGRQCWQHRGSPRINLTLANRPSGSWQHPLPWCGMVTGMGTPWPHSYVTSLWLSVRHSLDLAISVWGCSEGESPG